MKTLYSSILCPVDFSQCSEKALRVAAKLASGSGVKLTVMYAPHLEVPPYVNESAQVEIAKQMVSARIAAKDALESWAAPHLPPKLEVDYEIIERPPVDAIHQAADALGDCWIVMGTHGRTGLKRLFLGSVTERTLRESKVPVLTIPPDASRE